MNDNLKQDLFFKMGQVRKNSITGLSFVLFQNFFHTFSNEKKNTGFAQEAKNILICFHLFL